MKKILDLGTSHSFVFFSACLFDLVQPLKKIGETNFFGEFPKKYVELISTTFRKNLIHLKNINYL